jgi:cytochrome c-type biogenesis protein CcmH
VSIKLLFLSLFLVCLLAPLTPARDAQPLGDDPAVEARLQRLSKELRCLVCRNESLADSPAGLADDLRREIREQIKAGKSDPEIIAFLQARYGEYILYRPRVRPITYLLWFGPFVILLAGLAVLFRYIKHRRDVITEQPLSDDDRRRAKELLAASSGKGAA